MNEINWKAVHVCFHARGHRFQLQIVIVFPASIHSKAKQIYFNTGKNVLDINYGMQRSFLFMRKKTNFVDNNSWSPMQTFPWLITHFPKQSRKQFKSFNILAKVWMP